MSYFLGFDGGGTKTHCVLIDESGSVIGEGRSGPANPLRCGYAVAFASLRDAAAAALASSKIQPTDISAVHAGLAGAGRRSVIRRMMVFLAQEFSSALAQVSTDCEIALEAA